MLRNSRRPGSLWAAGSGCAPMEWIEENGESEYIFGFPGNPVLDEQVAEIADNVRFRHAKSDQLRTHTSFRYQASTWTHPCKVVARLEGSLQPDLGGTTTNGMRQEVDIRYVVACVKGLAEHLYEDVYCQRGQMENLIKLHKAQMASDRMSCHSATANQVRLILHTAGFWLMLAVRDAIPETDPLAKVEFNTLREGLIKISARVILNAPVMTVAAPHDASVGPMLLQDLRHVLDDGPHLRALRSSRKNSWRNSRQSTRTARKKPGRQATQRVPSSEGPPPGTRQWTYGRSKDSV
jgi:Transposase DDE domain group 1